MRGKTVTQIGLADPAESGQIFLGTAEVASPARFRDSSTTVSAVEMRGQIVDAKTYPLQDILKPERRYIIPTFQRDYEWTEDGQWRLLFEDLASTADRLLEARTNSAGGTTLAATEKTVSPHFLGAIVCASMPFPTGGVALRSVIDGQQRLTTAQLLVRGLLDVLAETGSERTKSVRRMLRNPADVVESPEEVHKLWPRRRDRDVWPTAMDDTVPSFAKGDHLYLQARQFFANAAREYATTEDQASDPARLTALADALASLFKLVVIDLDENDDAQVIFEVLNGRQTPLSAIDLVKNLLFLRGELAEDDVDTLYDLYWARFDDVWWKQEVGRGHAARGRRDVLLSAWLTAVTGQEASIGHLYREAREYLDGGPSTEHVLAELSQYAEAYRVIYGAAPVEDDRLGIAYERIKSLDITTAVPLLAWLRTLPTETLEPDDHVRAVRAVESWALRRVWVGWQTRGYGSHLTRVLREAKAAAVKEADLVEAVVSGLQGGVLAWPTDSDIADAFDTRRFYDNLTQTRIRLLLAAIDVQLRAENPHEPAGALVYDDLQIEHLMPRKWRAYWPVTGPDGRLLVADDTDPVWVTRSEERGRHLDRIGNLTLVTGTFNRDVSNRSWDVKAPEFAKQKSLALNYPIAQSPDWNEQRIQARAQELAAVAARIWPPPSEFFKPAR